MARICREAGVRVRTNVMWATSTLARSLGLTPFLARPNWQLTPWCPPSGQMGPPGATQHTGKALLWRKHEERRSVSSQSWSATGDVHASWWLKWERFSAEAAQFLRGLVSKSTACLTLKGKAPGVV